jgi:hypothetical protein
MSVAIHCDSCDKTMKSGDETYCIVCKDGWVQDYEDQIAALDEICDLEEQVSSKVETDG